MADVADIESDLEYTELAIIREIYDGQNAHDVFENELEHALDIECKNIVIEPAKLGEDTSQWIAVGNCLHKTAVLTGFGSVISGLIWPDKLYFSFPLGSVSLFCTGLYAVSWKTDPCSKYQVERNLKNLDKLPLESLSTSNPVVLVRKDDTPRFILQTTITLFAVAVCAFRIYRSLKNV